MARHFRDRKQYQDINNPRRNTRKYVDSERRRLSAVYRLMWLELAKSSALYSTRYWLLARAFYREMSMMIDIGTALCITYIGALLQRGETLSRCAARNSTCGKPKRRAATIIFWRKSLAKMWLAAVLAPLIMLMTFHLG